MSDYKRIHRRVGKDGFSQSPIPTKNPFKTRGFGKGLQARSAELPVTNLLQTRPVSSPTQQPSQQQETPDLDVQLERAEQFGYNGLDVPTIAAGATPPLTDTSLMVMTKSLNLFNAAPIQETDRVASQVIQQETGSANRPVEKLTNQLVNLQTSSNIIQACWETKADNILVYSEIADKVSNVSLAKGVIVEILDEEQDKDRVKVKVFSGNWRSMVGWIEKTAIEKSSKPEKPVAPLEKTFDDEQRAESKKAAVRNTSKVKDEKKKVENHVTKEDMEDFSSMVGKFNREDEDDSYYYLSKKPEGARRAINKIPAQKIKQSIDYDNPQIENLEALLEKAQESQKEKVVKTYTTVGFIITDRLLMEKKINEELWEKWKVAFAKINDKYEDD